MVKVTVVPPRIDYRRCAVIAKRAVSAVVLLCALALALSTCGGSSEALQHSNNAKRLADQGKLNEAIVELDEAIRLDPKLASAYNSRGVAYKDLGQRQRAIQDYDEAIRLDPKDAAPYVNRGLVYTKLNRDQEAERDFAKAIELGFDPARLKALIEELNKRR